MHRLWEGTTTLKMINTLRTKVPNYAPYRRTRDKIAAQVPSVAFDLGFVPDDAIRIAHRAVGG